MNQPQDTGYETPKVLIGADGEVIGGALPMPERPKPRPKSPVPLSVILIVFVTITVAAIGILSLLGIINPQMWINHMTRPLCFRRLGTDRIMFLSKRDGDDGVFIMNADGSNPCRLIDDSVGDDVPQPSANGKLIYYVVARNELNNLEVVNADGTNPHQLYTVGDLADVGFAVSPDSKRFAVTKLGLNTAQGYSGNRLIMGKLFQIYIMDADGSNTIQVGAPNIVETRPEWSPDGSKLVFEGSPTTTVAPYTSGPYVYMVNADGSNLHRLTLHQISEDYPTWSPDGKQILFTGEMGDGSSELYIINADGSNMRQLTHNGKHNGHARFSPDGKHIVFSSDLGGDYLDIYIMNADTTSIQRLTTNGDNAYPIWLPR